MLHRMLMFVSLQIRDDLSQIAETGIRCVYTSMIIPEKIKYDGRSILSIKGVRYRLKNNLHMVGWGKEAVTMSAAFERVVGKHLKKGWMVVPRKSIFMMWSYPEAFPPLDSRISYVEAGTDGQPDEKSVIETRRILNYCKKLKKKDLLIVMLSQGIDDLLCLPRETITLRDKLRVLNRLKAADATPEEINTVRNKLSAIRGKKNKETYLLFMTAKIYANSYFYNYSYIKINIHFNNNYRIKCILISVNSRIKYMCNR